jgi:hypothetical protein
MYAESERRLGAASVIGERMIDLPIKGLGLADHIESAVMARRLVRSQQKKRQTSCFPAPVRHNSGMSVTSVFGLLLL